MEERTLPWRTAKTATRELSSVVITQEFPIFSTPPKETMNWVLLRIECGGCLGQQLTVDAVVYYYHSMFGTPNIIVYLVFLIIIIYN